MIFNQLKSSLQKNLFDLSSANEKLASGKRISKPSDDVIGTARAMDYKLALNNIEQYKRNIDDAINHLEFSEKIMNSVSDSLIRAKELSIQGAAGALGDSDRLALAKEVEQLRDHLLNLSASKLRGRYIFSGFKTDISPFDPTTFDYLGDSGSINVIIDKGTTMGINIPGNNAFSTGGVTYFKMLDDLRISLQNNDSAGIQASVGLINDGLEQVINVTAEIGAKLNRLDDQINRLDDNTLSLKTLLSNVEDTDIAEAITEITKTQTVLEALRASSSRVMSQSLLDFLR